MVKHTICESLEESLQHFPTSSLHEKDCEALERQSTFFQSEPYQVTELGSFGGFNERLLFSPASTTTTLHRLSELCTKKRKQLFHTALSASDLNPLLKDQKRKMEKPARSHRSPEEVERALEVLNDELADASPLDRPSLELATQALTERLVEMRQQAAEGNLTSSSEGRKQSTQEYCNSLIPVVVSDGTQKYTLVRIPKQGFEIKNDIYLVRGDPKAEYHYQTALEILDDLRRRNIMSDVTGGGRISVSKAEKKVEIYGYSYQYGAADHAITAKLMKAHFGDDFIVSFGNYGY